MIKPDIPFNEAQRLKELEAYQLIGAAEDEDFDFITAMASQICDSKICLISLMQEDKQWFLSHRGLEAKEASREYSFCGHAINKPDEILMVEDARNDERFWDNPNTTGEPYVIFYAGVPLVTPNGYPLGTLCVIDDYPKKLDNNQIQNLKKLAKQTLNLFELRRSQLELKKANLELKKNIELFKITQSANNIGNWEIDIDTGNRVWNEVIYQILELPLNFDPNRAKDMEFYPPEYKAIITDSIEQCIAESKAFDIECKLITAKGNHKWVRAQGRKLENTVIGSFQDITSIKNSEVKFKGIFNSTFSFIGFLDTNGVLLEANDTAVHTAGIAQKDVIGKFFWDCYWWQISEEARQKLKVNFQKAAAGEVVTYEAIIWVANKTPLTILFSLKPVLDESGQVVYIIPEGRPVQEIVDTKNRLQSVIEGTNVGTWEWNVQTGATIFNERWADIVGYSLVELAPISIETWIKLAHPEDLRESEKRLNNCFERKTEFYELDIRMRHKDGHWVWVYDRGKVFEWSEDGKPLMMYGTHQDISERKAREEALSTVNKELETFSYTVAHDLRAPLRAMHGYAEMLNQDYYEILDEEAKRIINNIKQNASKMGRLIDDLLSFSRLGRKELLLTKINMGDLTKDVVLALNTSIVHKASIQVDALPEVMGDYTLLYQVMMNLISNAIKYSAKKENPLVRIFSEINKGETIFIVKDNGAGFNMKYSGKLFNVFQRLHTEYDFEGTGVGLATVSRIIEKHGGKIWAEGQVDVGATFYFTLPKNQ